MGWIETRKIEENSSELEKARMLYYSAFPEEERIDNQKLVQLLGAGRAVLLAIDEKTEHTIHRGVGYAYIIFGGTLNSSGYLLYFAIDKKWQKKGIGSAFISLLIRSNLCSQIFLDIEDSEEVTASNREERINRKNFYLKRGFHETSHKLSYQNCIYEILCTGRELKLDTIKGVIGELAMLGAEIEILISK